MRKLHPRVQELLNEASELYGVPIHNIVGPNRRRFQSAVKARAWVICQLVDPDARGAPSSFRWSVSEVARHMGLNHVSVLYFLGKLKSRTPLHMRSEEEQRTHQFRVVKAAHKRQRDLALKRRLEQQEESRA